MHRSRFTLTRLALLAGSLLVSLACGLAAPVPDPQPSSTAPAPAIPTATATASPEPTPNPSPTASPSPAPTEAPPKILFEENFDGESSCFTDRSLDPWVELGIVDGEYRIRVEGDNGFNTLCAGGYDDFVLEFDLSLTEGDDQSLVGLMFRRFVGSSYNLYLSGANEFCLDHYDADSSLFYSLAGCWDRLSPQFDVYSVLRIRLVAAQEQLAVFIDGEFIATAYAFGPDYGSFGFFIANSGSGTTEAAIDNIIIREIRPSDLDIFRDSQTG